MKRSLFLLGIIIFLKVNASAQHDPVIHADFPGGNVEVVKIEGDTIWLKPDLAETEGNWFYWNFKISGISGRTLVFNFTLENQLTTFGPAFSLNNDQTWKWYGQNRTERNSFSFSFGSSDTVAWFCTGFPYVGENLEAFLAGLENNHRLKTEPLCYSPEGRIIEKYLISPLRKEPSLRVLITARHHACEMMASYVLEGIMEGILNEVELAYLREEVEFLFIPFMDFDGVENGEQGKNRLPRDHNRDYSGKSVHASTGALRQYVPEWSEGKLKLALDLHCPWVKGAEHERIHLVGGSDTVMEAAQIRFSRMLELYAKGELRIHSKDFLAFGTSWNTGANHNKGIPFKLWAKELDHISLASSLEFPYASVLGIPVGKDNARAFGRAVAFAIRDYLMGIPESADVVHEAPGV